MENKNYFRILLLMQVAGLAAHNVEPIVPWGKVGEW